MTCRNDPVQRLLAIDPTPKGFGYVVLEGVDRLVDWGLAQVRGDKNEAAVGRVAALLRLYEPDLLLLENCAIRGSRRHDRIQRLLGRIAALATANRIKVRQVSPTAIRETFRGFGARNKDQIAGKIAEWFPELAPCLPKPRKPWMSEDERMGIFDAAALVFAEIAGLLDQRS